MSIVSQSIVGSLFPLAYDRPDGAFFPFGGGNAVAEPIPNVKPVFSTKFKTSTYVHFDTTRFYQHCLFIRIKYIKKNSKNLHPT